MTQHHQRNTVLMEIGDAVWSVVAGERTLELPLERQPSGRLTDACRNETTARLKEFLAAGHGSNPAALCAISARGVSLRRIQLPPSRAEDFASVLALQIEREFPLPPAQLAWGHQRLVGDGQGVGLMIAAVKREAVEDYATILTACGLEPVFTPGVFALGALAAGEGTVLNIGRTGTELAAFEQGVPASIRVLPWGDEQLLAGLTAQFGGDSQTASLWFNRLVCGEVPPAEWPAEVSAAVGGAAECLAALLQRASPARSFRLAGEVARIDGFDSQLSRALGGGVVCEALPSGRQPANSGVLTALHKLVSSGAIDRLLTLRPGGQEAVVRASARPLDRRWLALAAALAVGFFGLRYGGPLLRQPALETALVEAAAAKAALPAVDRELDFLRAIEKAQPAYLNGLVALADATPRGTRLESLRMNSRGEFAFSATLQNPQQANDLRTKLIDSGIFSNVVIEEQSPTPDQRQAKIRLRARWNPSSEVKSPVLDRVAGTAPTTKTNSPPRGGAG
jgi:hypothetical protein